MDMDVMEIINARIANPSADDVAKKGRLNPLKWICKREVTGEMYGASSHKYYSQSYSKTKFFKGLYNSFGHSGMWNNSSGNPNHYGAIFNFDFTPDGSALVAASERRSILMFDPLTHKMCQANTEAHQDCVNVVKFIDDRLFATCSDDRMVKLWDLRKMEKEMQTLSGHSNWVKNIECIDGKLLTSGFDGNIIMWDYHKYTDTGEVPHKVLFQTRNLMRTALSADHSKLVMSTSSGYIMVVHDFDINTIADDLNGFKPNIYRLMQMNPTSGNTTIAYNHLFQDNRKSNRLELIADFTDNTDVEIIASLQIHPSGNYIVSRNNSSDEQCEHTCVHDLRSAKDRKSAKVENGDKTTPNATTNQSATASSQYLLSLAVDQASTTTPANQSDMLASAQQRLDNIAANYAGRDDQFMIFIQGGSDGVHQTLVLFADDRRSNGLRRPTTQHKNAKLIYYVEEPNMGRGFIKEPCFSNDGRIVCSPFAHGVRLLGFNSECNQVEDGLYLATNSNNKARELQEVASVYSHQNLVVSTKYSPTQQLLVTGCLDGQVGFHQPLL